MVRLRLSLGSSCGVARFFNQRPRLSLVVSADTRASFTPELRLRPRSCLTEQYLIKAFNQKVHYSTSLYTTTDESERSPFVMKPDIDFDEMFKDENLIELKDSILKRKMHFDLSKLIYLWEKVKNVKNNMNFLEARREKLKTESKALKNKQNNNSLEVNLTSRTEGKRLRENLKKATVLYNSLSDELYLLALQLPNVLNSKTPIEERIVLESWGKKQENTEDHVQHHELSFKHDIVKPGSCYVSGEASMLGMALEWWMSDALMDSGFTKFSSPDMYKAAPLEAFGINTEDSKQVFFVDAKETSMYLTGVSSAAFSAYYMMSVIEDDQLPQRSFSVGTHYDSSKVSKPFTILPNIMERRQVEIGCICHASNESEAVFQQTVSMLLQFYSKLPVHFRLVQCNVQDFLPSMYEKQAIEVWLPSTQQYHQVACIYSCTDYISRRLKIRYPADPRQTAAQSRKRIYPHTIHGTAIDIPVLQAVLLETCQIENYKLLIPDELNAFFPTETSS